MLYIMSEKNCQPLHKDTVTLLEYFHSLLRMIFSAIKEDANCVLLFIV